MRDATFFACAARPVTGGERVTRVMGRVGVGLRRLAGISGGAEAERRRTVAADDLSLIATVRGGGEAGSDAYRTLVERYQEKVYRIAFEVLRSHEDAQDATQESFVKAFLALKEFKGDSSFYTWLYRIAFNMSVDWKRKVARRPSQELKEDSVPYSGPLSGTVEGPHAALVRKEQGDKIQEVLKELSDEHRTVVVLREVEGMSYEEIADVVGVSKGTVMSRLFYARRKLQEGLVSVHPERDEVADSSDTSQNANEKGNL